MITTSKRIYRFLPFHYAVQFLKTGNLSFSKPSSWDDPFEKDYDSMKGRDVYAQCWTLAYHSDALWRIYSPTHLGVRIRTTIGKLNSELSHFNESYKVHTEAKNVKYCKHRMLREEQENANTTQRVFIKRDAFEHEKEFRIVLAVAKKNKYVEKNDNRILLKIKSNTTDFIDLVMLDPRAPRELVEALKLYFKKEFNNSLRCIQSRLYKYDKDDELPI
jgi:hypothetical protein